LAAFFIIIKVWQGFIIFRFKWNKEATSNYQCSFKRGFLMYTKWWSSIGRCRKK
jgi:hypothetical protein